MPGSRHIVIYEAYPGSNVLITTRAWRHTRAIQLLESGVDIVKVQKFLGHSSIQNTLIYLKYSYREFDRAILQANESIGLR
ncbi:MAG: hypothetical protein A2015_09660 [Spirochaetes bacterium GWF1_31_7]|nr:MAG: hypothetical protein A2Y30_04515 [Spirochaetes bacterium GWE1_32_154]OHD47552.1 MAG: hypothetical protein A2015_09660 [Spirochaetes bacterium GWF1_31_7]OHD52042.1 MAG: hypothetical protein A2Y29_17420 [Spirochaetes bacterium GWE2_31_10]HBD93461.1 hypothetical protein [Spirochaetia bacterium]HBI36231.1 hypothetical protein [Spirochaetia bacterium]